MNDIRFDGQHYETGSLRNIFTLQGVQMPHTKLPPSEALLFGVSGGITFGYFSFAYQGIDPQVALLTRNTFDPLENIFNRLGVIRTVRQTTNAVKAENNLFEALDFGEPALVWADRISLAYCPYDGMLGEDMYEMIPLVVFGRDAQKGTVFIADQSRVPLEAPLAELTRARGRVKKDKFRQITISLPSLDKLTYAVTSGIRACIQSFSTSPVKGYARNFGFAAYQRWADILIGNRDKQSWDKVFPSGRSFFAGVSSAFERIELFGTGGAASRPLFANFLAEASVLLNNPALQESSAQFRDLSLLWTAFGNELLPDDQPLFKETKQLLLKKRALFWEQGGAASGEIVLIHNRLKEIRSIMEEDFPLSVESVTALKYALREHILKIHAAEQEAIAALENAIAG